MKLRLLPLRTLIFFLVLLSLLASLIYLAVQLLLAPDSEALVQEGEKQKSDYVLMLVQCGLGVVVLFLPSMLEHRLRLDVPDAIEILYFLFLYAAIYLGEVRSFYYRIPNWDLILHAFSGLMLGALGFSVVNLLNRDREVRVALSPAFVALFAFLFASTVGVLWEIYEYCVDGLLQTNMQKFALESGAALTGREALADTMEDLILDCAGAALMSAAGYLSLKRGRPWLDKMAISVKREDPPKP